MMKTFMNCVLAATIAVTTIAVGGCQKKPLDLSPAGAMGDPFPAPQNDPQITVLSEELRSVLGFHPAIVTDDGQRPMQVEIPVRNLVSKLYLIEYRVMFYDANDRELTPRMGWQMEPLYPKELARLKGSALSTDATHYRVEVRYSR